MERYSRVINFTTTAANQEILDLPEIKAELVKSLNIGEDYYEEYKKKGILMSFFIIVSNTQVSVNGGIYNDLLENYVYDSDGVYHISSIKIKNSGAKGTFSFTLK
jgi:hypothetical protein